MLITCVHFVITILFGQFPLKDSDQRYDAFLGLLQLLVWLGWSFFLMLPVTVEPLSENDCFGIFDEPSDPHPNFFGGNDFDAHSTASTLSRISKQRTIITFRKCSRHLYYRTLCLLLATHSRLVHLVFGALEKSLSSAFSSFCNWFCRTIANTTDYCNSWFNQCTILIYQVPNCSSIQVQISKGSQFRLVKNPAWTFFHAVILAEPLAKYVWFTITRLIGSFLRPLQEWFDSYPRQFG